MRHNLYALLLMFAAGAAAAQNYPVKPIRIVTSGVGGGNDAISRIIAAGITGPLGQPIVIENRGGIIPGEMLSKAPPDGYLLMLQGASVWLAPFLQPNVSFDPLRDFAPITLADKSPNTIVVHPSVPVKNVKELIALAKSKVGALNYSSGNSGSPNHLAGELFKSMAGVNIVRIPYKSGAQETTDLIAGQVHMAFSPTGSVMAHVKSGKLRLLAVASDGPSALAPGVPTVASSGLPGYQMGSIHAVFAPAGTPPAIINRLNQEMVRYLRLPEVKDKLLAMAVESVGSTPEELGATIKSEMSRLGKLIKDVGIKAD
jgi:tripartite-type tricarboxylate transporter receptor subunit TctC